LKLTGTMAALLLVVLLFALAIPEVGQAETIKIVSGPDWKVTVTVPDSNGNPVEKDLGNAQDVCLNATAPSNCPVTAMPPPVQYGYPYPGWVTLLGATWIWATISTAGGTTPITGTTSGAAGAKFTFETEFYLCGTPQDGEISVAADDSAEVTINGHSLVVQDITKDNHSHLAHLTVPASMFNSPQLPGLPSQNKIQVTVKNWDDPADCGSDQYHCNPAGFVFEGTFSDGPQVPPQCPGMKNPGATKPAACPDGETGSVYVCACNGNWVGPFGACQKPPQCTGTDGTKYDPGAPESLVCKNGQMAVGVTSHKCQTDGTWDVPLGKCQTPTMQCTGADGSKYDPGASEPLVCKNGQTGVGVTSHKCQTNGTWDVPLGNCVASVGPGGVCEQLINGELVQVGICPTGIDCAPRVSCPAHGTGSRTADSYCGPLSPQLGQHCTTNCDCGSGWCDSGDGTSKTGLCMPKPGTGNINDLCSDNKQCASGRCGDLFQDLSSNWHPGHCSSVLKSPLHDYCSVNSDCISNNCDRGDGTSKTSRCMPWGPTGKTGDWCSNNNQCSKGVCMGLQQDANKNWLPGHCN